MANLVNRKPLNTTVENTLRDLFDKLSEQTRIPKSRLLDEALEDLLKKYSKEA